MESKIATSTTLDLAADAIQMGGWRQGSGWDADRDGALCLEGGIMAAAGITSAVQVDHCPAALAVVEYLGADQCEYKSPFAQSIRTRAWVWNDQPGRTAEEVIEVLRATAAVERLKESTAGLNVTLAYDTEDQPLPIKVAA